mmetsp:Transcript_5084/g.8892  ORF Transcript_5084/g.8892 Transcript_5084/m.8892 type:complete len:173 (+) Transcript_5084:48-566(+)
MGGRDTGLDEVKGEEDFYSLLGVRDDATIQEIEKAWRKKALETHPDKVPESERASATERFKAIAHAHDVLSNPETRLLYDRHGPSLEAVRPPPSDEALEELLEILRTQFFAAAPPPPPPMTLADVRDGVLGLGLLGIVALTCWSLSPKISRWTMWCWWHWQFFLHDLSSWHR